MSVRICVFGLGEAGSEIAAGLAAGADVTAFDPAAVSTPLGVTRCDRAEDAVDRVDMVVSITAAADAPTALAQALASIPPSAHYADFSTAAPTLKRSLAATATAAGLRFTDVALMGTVPGRGIRTPAIASGPDAEACTDALAGIGMEITVVGRTAGDAATQKLLRSVFVKGLAAVLAESVEAAEHAGLADETWRSIVGQVERADESFLERLMAGTARHARRRRDEMQAATELLVELGVDPIMTSATTMSLDRVQGGDTPGSENPEERM